MKVLIAAIAASLAVDIQGLSPMPCPDVATYYADADTSSGARLEIDQTDWESPVAKVYSAGGDELYDMSVFPCHQDVYVSPNGKIVLYDGNHYFPQWMTDPDEKRDVTISTVYVTGQHERDIKFFADLNGDLIPETGDEDWFRHDYGYVGRQFEIEEVKWDENTIQYEGLKGQDGVNIPLIIYGEPQLEVLA